MKTLLPVATALALVGAVNPSSAIAQGAKPSGFASSPIWLPAAACQRASACRCR